jgi:integrase
VQGRNWTNDFYDWMIRTGRPATKKGQPTLGMKESTARDYLQRICRLLDNTNPPYLNAVVISRKNGDNGKKVERDWESGDRLEYTVAKPIETITVDHLISGIKALFPTIDQSVVPNYRHFQQAGVAFIRWLIWEKKNRHGRAVLTDEDMEIWRGNVPSLAIKDIPQLEIVDPEIIDDFLAWLNTRNRDLWASAWLMRNLGLRYSGLRRATVDLRGGPKKDDGSLNLSIQRKYTRQGNERVLLERPHLTIYEKQRPRDFDLPRMISDFLLRQQAYQRSANPGAKFLFTNQWGNQYHVQSGTFNHALQAAYVNFHKETFGQDPPENEVTIMTAHKLRHACGVDLVRKRMPEKLIRDILGHVDQKTLDRYIQHVRDDLSDIWSEAMDNGNGGGMHI